MECDNFPRILLEIVDCFLQGTPSFHSDWKILSICQFPPFPNYCQGKEITTNQTINDKLCTWFQKHTIKNHVYVCMYVCDGRHSRCTLTPHTKYSIPQATSVNYTVPHIRNTVEPLLSAPPPLGKWQVNAYGYILWQRLPQDLNFSKNFGFPTKIFFLNLSWVAYVWVRLTC